MLSLTIHHNIHLTKEQRHALHDGEDIVTVGYSVPVWFMGKVTSEPAREVFCVYSLKNPKKDVPIQIMENGYEITIPYREGSSLKISNEEWLDLLMNNPDKLDAMYKQHISEVSSKNILDVSEGGCGGLVYREHNKTKMGDKILNIMHYVSIEPIEMLLNSLTSHTLAI